MAIINYNKKLKCGPVLGSSCVTWDGGYSGVLTDDNVACDATIEDVALILSNETNTIKTSLDLATFTPHDLPFDKNTQQVKDLLQKISDALQTLKDGLAALTTRVTDVETGDINMEVDLDCLSDEISNCETPPSYSLKSILELLISKNC